MKKRISYLLNVSLVISICFFSCKKDETPEDNDITAAGDNSYAENIANDISMIGSQALDNSGNSLSTYKVAESKNEFLFISCATVNLDSASQKVIVTFNNTMCTDGRVRNGSLVYDYSQSLSGAYKYRSPGFKCTVTSSNYSVDGNLVKIQAKTIENTTPVNFNAQSTNLTWKINSDISVTKTDGSTLTWKCLRNKVLLNTSDTLVYRGNENPIVWGKAKIGITGNASGVTAEGNAYSATITSQLIRDFNCSPIATAPHRHPFIQGIIEFTPEKKLTRRINYGSGNCDLEASISVGNYSKTITLR